MATTATSGADSSDRYAIEHLNDTNYETWSRKMRHSMNLKHHWSHVQQASVPDTPEAQEKDGLAISYIHMFLSEKAATSIAKCTTAKEVWDKLQAKYQTKNATRRLLLTTEFNALKQNPNESVDDYVARASKLHAQLESAGGATSEHNKAAQILNGLRPEFDNTVEIIMSKASDDGLDIDDLMSQLLLKEQKNAARYTSNTALVAKPSYNNNKHYRKGGGSRPRRGC